MWNNTRKFVPDFTIFINRSVPVPMCSEFEKKEKEKAFRISGETV